MIRWKTEDDSVDNSMDYCVDKLSKIMAMLDQLIEIYDLYRNFRVFIFEFKSCISTQNLSIG